MFSLRRALTAGARNHVGVASHCSTLAADLTTNGGVGDGSFDSFEVLLLVGGWVFVRACMF